MGYDDDQDESIESAREIVALRARVFELEGKLALSHAACVRKGTALDLRRVKRRDLDRAWSRVAELEAKLGESA